MTDFHLQFHRAALTSQSARYRFNSRRSKQEAEAVVFPTTIIILLECEVAVQQN